MFSSETGQCKYFNGINAIYTPFVRSACFETSYLPSQPENNPNTQCPDDVKISNSLNCIPVYGRRGSCHFDRECGPISKCSNGSCVKSAPFDARNSIWRRENSRIVGYAPSNFTNPKGNQCPNQPYIVEDETKTQKVICPVFGTISSQPQCATCINTVFSCDRFIETDKEAYDKCNEYKRMIHYNVITPNGQPIPLSAEMENEGMEVLDIALKKCAHVCKPCGKIDHTSYNTSFNSTNGQFDISNVPF